MKNLQIIIDQFLPGDYKIVEASEWYELHDGKRCYFSSPSRDYFIDEILEMIAEQIELAEVY